ncbi:MULTISPECIES: hypothetical protein [Mycolicibacterium]|jgi:hypothetical protein|uniref:Transmembrane protein n=2 Tax=Mycolicibacterium TaxID=1866885 RepID=A1T9E9_MYCVP|nr:MULTISPECIES: hypothetical protein [Mycolicibacterium]ABM13799.1 hypothetical protein Mvan_2994 [Mycolicibacterium vanbaalenii PYR-1]MCV7130470.1 hypothetical protein [Mycolicibacterium vanbaalenii PYR-1]MDN4518862.1 hypothetical protein [Mycolicibacterium austroafricanum]MDW5609824.1 hypothetical protein [Mycolicibacterium sp. D5.8-2]PQP50653.1 hypothetical protein C6A88_09595 [Mycolicibacterium austroafricanum]
MSTLWLYARIQGMALLFGLVGPIFLFVYFAAQPDPTLRWMYWWGLLITAADILIALAVTDSVVSRDRDIADKAARLPRSRRD